VARFLNIHRRTLARWVLDEALKFPKPIIFHGRWAFIAAEIEAFVAQRRIIAAHEIERLAAAAQPEAKTKAKTKGKEPARERGRLRRNAATHEHEAA
jgi:hypothetical protein